MLKSIIPSFLKKKKPEIPAPRYVPFSEEQESSEPIYNTGLIEGCIVTIPEGMYCPTVYCNGRERKVTCGQVTEVYPNLVAVQFFGYPNTVDYSLREALEFEVNAHCSRARHFSVGSEVMKIELN